MKSNAIEELLKHNVLSAELKGYHLVHQAIRQGDIKSAILLVKAGASFSECYTSAPNDFTLMQSLFWTTLQTVAAKNQYFKLMQELINHGYDLNSDDFRANALYQTLSNSHIHAAETIREFLEFFIKNGADPRKLLITDNVAKGSSWTPLFQAIATCDIQKSLVAIKVLLDAGADINQKASPVWLNIPGFDGITITTPLFFAIKWWQRIDASNNGVVNLLIEHGATL